MTTTQDLAEIDRLTILKYSLKSGDYDGTDIMRAWIAIDELIKIKENNNEY